MTNRTNRAEIASRTLAILERGHYVLPNGATISVADATARCCEQTRLYEPEDLTATLATLPDVPPAAPAAVVEVRNETTLAGIARLSATSGDAVAALNFASAKNPGGGFLGGSQAQEESLARSSALYPSLMTARAYYERHRQSGSPLYTDALIVSPDCPVFRDDAGGLLERVTLASFVTCAAPNAGAIRKSHPHEVHAIPVALERRARYVLAVAAARGLRHLVLGAWGCGVFQNSPGMVADTFARLLNDEQWARRFDRIAFSVLDTSSSLDIFQAFAKRLAARA